MDAVEFRTHLESLEKGDVVTFVFKRMVHWATHFIKLFNVRPHAFEVLNRGAVDLELINLFMEARWVSTSSYPVVCNVLRRLDEAQIDKAWMVRHLFPLLEDITVQKHKNPNK